VILLGRTTQKNEFVGKLAYEAGCFLVYFQLGINVAVKVHHL
jgi:hypothetical protein